MCAGRFRIAHATTPFRVKVFCQHASVPTCPAKSQRQKETFRLYCSRLMKCFRNSIQSYITPLGKQTQSGSSLSDFRDLRNNIECTLVFRLISRSGVGILDVWLASVNRCKRCWADIELTEMIVVYFESVARIAVAEG